MTSTETKTWTIKIRHWNNFVYSDFQIFFGKQTISERVKHKISWNGEHNATAALST